MFRSLLKSPGAPWSPFFIEGNQWFLNFFQETCLSGYFYVAFYWAEVFLQEVKKHCVVLQIHWETCFLNYFCIMVLFFSKPAWVPLPPPASQTLGQLHPDPCHQMFKWRVLRSSQWRVCMRTHHWADKGSSPKEWSPSVGELCLLGLQGRSSSKAEHDTCSLGLNLNLMTTQSDTHSTYTCKPSLQGQGCLVYSGVIDPKRISEVNKLIFM